MKGFKMQVLLTVALLCAAGTVQANWVTIDFPGATGTYPQGIYGNRIVGYYEDGAGDYHGFLYEGADWTTLDAPDAIDTRSFGIDGDNIVGWYQDPAGWHGFLCDGTSWQTVDVPGAHSTMAYGIDGANIVGLYDGKGFLYDGSNWTTLVFPGASYTHISDIDGHTMVGVYSVFYAPGPQTPYGFFYDGTTWTPLPEGDLGVCPSNWFNRHSFCFLLAPNPDYREGEFPCGESNVLLSQSGTHRCRKTDVCYVS